MPLKELPEDVLRCIASYIIYPMKLRDWVDSKKLFPVFISKLPEAICLLEKDTYCINWAALHDNPDGIYILKKNPERIYWKYLSAKKYFIRTLEKNL